LAIRSTRYYGFTIPAVSERVNLELLRAALYRLALEAPQLLLLMQQAEPFDLAGFRLVRALHQSGQLTIEELIPQAQYDTSKLRNTAMKERHRADTTRLPLGQREKQL
jgi:hypothetical protein